MLSARPPKGDNLFAVPGDTVRRRDHRCTTASILPV